jgi:hypothetical protein
MLGRGFNAIIGFIGRFTGKVAVPPPENIIVPIILQGSVVDIRLQDNYLPIELQNTTIKVKLESGNE